MGQRVGSVWRWAWSIARRSSAWGSVCSTQWGGGCVEHCMGRCVQQCVEHCMGQCVGRCEGEVSRGEMRSWAELVLVSSKPYVEPTRAYPCAERRRT